MGQFSSGQAQKAERSFEWAWQKRHAWAWQHMANWYGKKKE
jgi:hypothetical protein